MNLLDRIEAARTETRPWMARPPERINWFDVLRNACALAYVLTVGMVAVALAVASVVAVVR